MMFFVKVNAEDYAAFCEWYMDNNEFYYTNGEDDFGIKRVSLNGKQGSRLISYYSFIQAGDVEFDKMYFIRFTEATEYENIHGKFSKLKPKRINEEELV